MATIPDINPELAQIIAALRRTHDRDISGYDKSFLAKTLAKRLAVTSCQTATSYLDRLTADHAEAEIFFQSLNISYSEFFRNPLTFALLEQLVLPGLVEAAGKSDQAEIRIWSAGCAAGQEAWSVAILLDELLAARGSPVSFRIIATDVAEDELTAARRGVYDEAAVQNVRLRHLRDCFVREGTAYVVAPRLRSRVDFSTYDLLDKTSAGPPAGIFGEFDLVLCSNLLFYYRPGPRSFILDKVHACLAPRGYLATGEAERSIVDQAGGFRTVATPVAVFQKTGRQH